MKTGTYVLPNSFNNVLSWVDPDELLMIGIGRTTAWPTESAPPSPSVTNTTQQELLGYVKVTAKRPVKEVDVATVDTVSVNGKLYLPVAATLNAVTSNGINKVLLEATLLHDDVIGIASTYRSLGVYRYVELTSGVLESQTFFELADLDSKVFVYLLHTPPVTLQSSVEEEIKLVFNV